MGRVRVHINMHMRMSMGMYGRGYQRSRKTTGKRKGENRRHGDNGAPGGLGHVWMAVEGAWGRKTGFLAISGALDEMHAHS